MGGTAAFVVSAGAARRRQDLRSVTGPTPPRNPYTSNTVAESAIDGVGGSDHLGRHRGGVVTTEAEAQAPRTRTSTGATSSRRSPGSTVASTGRPPVRRSSPTVATSWAHRPLPPHRRPRRRLRRRPRHRRRPTPQGKVSICHRTNSVKNPYVFITIDESGAINGHAGHTGPIVTSRAQAQSLKNQKIKWGDIIPPIDPGLPGGLNWPAGQSILNAGCTFAPPPPTTAPPTTTRPPSSTTRPPSSTTLPPPTTRPVTPTTKPPTPARRSRSRRRRVR